MKRRTVVTTAAIALAGCAGAGGDTLIDETVRSEKMIPLDLDDGQTLEIDVERQEGMFAQVLIYRKDTNDELLNEVVESESRTIEVTIPDTATWTFFLSVEGVSDFTVIEK